MPAIGALFLLIVMVTTAVGLAATGAIADTAALGVTTGLIKGGMYLAITAAFGYGFTLTLLYPGEGRTRRAKKGEKPFSLTADQNRLRTGALLASLATIVLMTGTLLLRYIDAAGSDFSRLAFFASSTDVGEISVNGIVLMAIAALFFALGRRQFWMGWAMAALVAAIVALGFLGHAGASIDHNNAVNAMLLHLLGMALWLGPLLVLVHLAARRTDAAVIRTVLARFSPWAVFAIACLAFSGLVNGLIRLSSISDLVTTGYGLLVLAKTIGLVAIALAGASQRRKLVADAPFRRLAIVEIAVAAAVIGLSIALGRSQPPVPQFISRDSAELKVLSLVGFEPPTAPFDVPTLFTQWHIDWLALGFSLTIAALYIAGVVRLKRRGDAWVWHRTAFFLAGSALFIWVMSGGPGTYGRVQFDGHMVQHMALMIIVPPLWVLGAPVTLMSRAVSPRTDGSRGMREWVLAILHSKYGDVVSSAPVAGFIFAGSLVAFYFTPLFTWAMFTHAGHAFMTIHFLLSGYLFAWVIIGVDPSSRPINPILKLVTLLVTLSFHAFFGLAVISASWIIGGDWYHALGMADAEQLMFWQKRGGSIMWGVSEVPTLLYAIVMTWQWTRAEDRTARQYDRKAERDQGAELEAYNEYLRTLREQSRS